MAFKKINIFFVGFLISAVYSIPLVATQNIDCKGKAFHCVNSTHFKICVDLGGGISTTVDNFLIPCPKSTICNESNYFECEYVSRTTLKPFDKSDESTDKNVTTSSKYSDNISTLNSNVSESKLSEIIVNSTSTEFRNYTSDSVNGDLSDSGSIHVYETTTILALENNGTMAATSNKVTLVISENNLSNNDSDFVSFENKINANSKVNETLPNINNLINDTKKSANSDKQKLTSILNAPTPNYEMIQETSYTTLATETVFKNNEEVTTNTVDDTPKFDEDTVYTKYFINEASTETITSYDNYNNLENTNNMAVTEAVTIVSDQSLNSFNFTTDSINKYNITNEEKLLAPLTLNTSYGEKITRRLVIVNSMTDLRSLGTATINTTTTVYWTKNDSTTTTASDNEIKSHDSTYIQATTEPYQLNTENIDIGSITQRGADSSLILNYNLIGATDYSYTTESSLNNSSTVNNDFQNNDHGFSNQPNISYINDVKKNFSLKDNNTSDWDNKSNTIITKPPVDRTNDVSFTTFGTNDKIISHNEAKETTTDTNISNTEHIGSIIQGEPENHKWIVETEIGYTTESNLQKQPTTTTKNDFQNIDYDISNQANTTIVDQVEKYFTLKENDTNNLENTNNAIISITTPVYGSDIDSLIISGTNDKHISYNEDIQTISETVIPNTERINIGSITQFDVESYKWIGAKDIGYTTESNLKNNPTTIASSTVNMLENDLESIDYNSLHQVTTSYVKQATNELVLTENNKSMLHNLSTATIVPSTTVHGTSYDSITAFSTNDTIISRNNEDYIQSTIEPITSETENINIKSNTQGDSENSSPTLNYKLIGETDMASSTVNILNNDVENIGYSSSNQVTFTTDKNAVFNTTHTFVINSTKEEDFNNTDKTNITYDQPVLAPIQTINVLSNSKLNNTDKYDYKLTTHYDYTQKEDLARPVTDKTSNFEISPRKEAIISTKVNRGTDYISSPKVKEFTLLPNILETSSLLPQSEFKITANNKNITDDNTVMLSKHKVSNTSFSYKDNNKPLETNNSFLQKNGSIYELTTQSNTDLKNFTEDNTSLNINEKESTASQKGDNKKSLNITSTKYDGSSNGLVKDNDKQRITELVTPLEYNATKNAENEVFTQITYYGNVSEADNVYITKKDAEKLTTSDVNITNKNGAVKNTSDVKNTESPYVTKNMRDANITDVATTQIFLDSVVTSIYLKENFTPPKINTRNNEYKEININNSNNAKEINENSNTKLTDEVTIQELKTDSSVSSLYVGRPIIVPQHNTTFSNIQEHFENNKFEINENENKKINNMNKIEHIDDEVLVYNKSKSIELTTDLKTFSRSEDKNVSSQTVNTNENYKNIVVKDPNIEKNSEIKVLQHLNISQAMYTAINENDTETVNLKVKKNISYKDEQYIYSTENDLSKVTDSYRDIISIYQDKNTSKLNNTHVHNDENGEIDLVVQILTGDAHISEVTYSQNEAHKNNFTIEKVTANVNHSSTAEVNFNPNTQKPIANVSDISLTLKMLNSSNGGIDNRKPNLQIIPVGNYNNTRIYVNATVFPYPQTNSEIKIDTDSTSLKRIDHDKHMLNEILLNRKEIKVNENSIESSNKTQLNITGNLTAKIKEFKTISLFPITIRADLEDYNVKIENTTPTHVQSNTNLTAFADIRVETNYMEVSHDIHITKGASVTNHLNVNKSNTIEQPYKNNITRKMPLVSTLAPLNLKDIQKTEMNYKINLNVIPENITSLERTNILASKVNISSTYFSPKTLKNVSESYLSRNISTTLTSRKATTININTGAQISHNTKKHSTSPVAPNNVQFLYATNSPYLNNVKIKNETTKATSDYVVSHDADVSQVFDSKDNFSPLFQISFNTTTHLKSYNNSSFELSKNISSILPSAKNINNEIKDVLIKEPGEHIHNKTDQLYTINKQNILHNAKKILVPSRNTTSHSASFDCKTRSKGKYSDSDDCNTFYICLGQCKPVTGKCPPNTIFSDIKKQCTKNLSHCIRNNQFKCLTEGRFIDILSNNYYYICAKTERGFVRFKFKCQEGYQLDKKPVHCLLKSTSDENVSINTSEIRSNENISTENEKLITTFVCEKEGKFKFPEDCRKYFVCKRKSSEFRRKIKKCDSDEVFDSDKKRCVDQETNECDNIDS